MKMPRLAYLAAVPLAFSSFGCSSGSSGGGIAPGAQVQPITQFRVSDWNLKAANGAEQPVAVNGGLRLESTSTTGPRSSSGIGSRVLGQYSDAGVTLKLARPNTMENPADYDAFLSLDIDARTQSLQNSVSNEVATKARIGLSASASGVNLVVQVNDADGNPIEQRTKPIGTVDLVAAGENGGTLLNVPIPLRIAADLDQQVVRFYRGGTLEYTYVPTTLSLPASSAVGVDATGRGFDVFAEEFNVLDVETTEPSFSVQLAKGFPRAETPGRVQFVFNLRDQEDTFINLPETQLNGGNLFFAENEFPIDRAEANPIFKRAMLPQDVVIVLDFTQSLATSGGIDDMIVGAKDLAAQVWASNAENRLQVWEFHDSFEIASRILPQPTQSTNWLKVDKQSELESAIDDFAATTYNGFSRVFDAVGQAAASSFGEDPRDAVHSVAFLTDGFDTGSAATAQSLIGAAQFSGYSLNPIAVEAQELPRRWLRRLAAETGGSLYDVPTINQLAQAFRELGGGLDSLYSASYVSSQASTAFNVSLDLELLIGGVTQPVSLPMPIEAGINLVKGDTRRGLLEFEQVSFTNSTTSPNIAKFRADAAFIPRGVTMFKVGEFDGLPAGAQVTVRTVGDGLLSGWTNFGPAPQPPAAFEANGTSLQFGDFGGFLEIEVANIPVTATSLSFEGTIFNDIYSTVGFETNNGFFLPPQMGAQSNFRFFVDGLQPPQTP